MTLETLKNLTGSSKKGNFPEGIWESYFYILAFDLDLVRNVLVYGSIIAQDILDVFGWDILIYRYHYPG